MQTNSSTGGSSSVHSGGGDSGYFGNGAQPYPSGGGAASSSSPHPHPPPPQQHQTQQSQQFVKPTHYDGMLEVVGVFGVVHMGQIVSGLRTGHRLAQGGHVSHDGGGVSQFISRDPFVNKN